MSAAPGLYGTFAAQQRPSGDRVAARCGADRVLMAGGAFADLLLHPVYTPFQRIFRALPTDAIFQASRAQPAQIELGSVTVPAQMSLALCEYSFRPYRFDGVIAGDAVPLEEYRGSLEIANLVSLGIVNQPGNISAQAVPAVPPAQATAYDGIVSGGAVIGGAPTQGESSSFPGVLNSIYGPGSLIINNPTQPALNQPALNPNQFITTVQGAASIIPQRPELQQGPNKFPFTYLVNESQPVTLLVTVFAPVRVPIAFFEGTLSGYLVPKNTVEALLEGMKPCQGA